MNLGPRIFTWEKKKKKERKKTLLLMELVNICCCSSWPGAPGDSGGRRNRQIKVEDRLLSAPSPSKDTEQTGGGLE